MLQFAVVHTTLNTDRLHRGQQVSSNFDQMSDIMYLMSPNFLVMALPRVLKAAEVLCPAVDSVSDVFL